MKKDAEDTLIREIATKKSIEETLQKEIKKLEKYEAEIKEALEKKKPFEETIKSERKAIISAEKALNEEKENKRKLDENKRNLTEAINAAKKELNEATQIKKEAQKELYWKFIMYIIFAFLIFTFSSVLTYSVLNIAQYPQIAFVLGLDWGLNALCFYISNVFIKNQWLCAVACGLLYSFLNPLAKLTIRHLNCARKINNCLKQFDD